MRITIFVATPVVPVLITLQALSMTTKKRQLEAEWLRKQESIYKLYLKHSKLDREKRKVMKALADMKMIEVSTEAVPQFFILIVFTIFSSLDSCVGFLTDNDPLTTTFLALSLLQTYTTIILSTITSINIRKGGQLDVKSKIVLGLSISCQLAARLQIMVPLAKFMLSYSRGRVKGVMTGAVLLVLPIPIGWFFTYLLNKLLNTDFYLLSTNDKLIHLLSTTWFTVPVRRMEERDQRHKGREAFFSLLLAGINLVGTWAALTMTYGVREHDICLQSLFLYLVGCGLLFYFEKSVHPWRDLGKERESHCWGKLQGTKRGIEAELTLWEQVKVSLNKQRQI